MSKRISSTERKMLQIKLPHSGPAPIRDLGLTILTAFYNDHERFDRIFNVWKGYTKEIKRLVHISIVDDGSKHPLHELIESKYMDKIDFSLTVYRIDENIKWNTPGAWNLGITQAPTDWVVNVASDCCFDSDNVEKMLTLRPLKGMLYKFHRKRITNDPNRELREGQPHPEVFLQDKETFLRIGGFDEDFTGKHSGGYGIWDNYFAQKFTRMKIPYGIINEIDMIEWLEDITGGNVQWREGVRDPIVGINRALWGAKINGVVPECDASKIIRFSWRKVVDVKRGNR